MSDNNYQKVSSDSGSPVAKLITDQLVDDNGTETAGPSTKEMILGLGLFSFSIALYSIYCMLIKIMLSSYKLSVPEINYYISLFLVLMFYAFAKQQRVEIFNVPKEAQKDLLLRCIFGVLSDVLLFVAFEKTSFSKAFCLFFTNTLMAPFLGKAILGEPIKKWDVIGILCGFGGMLMLVQPFSSQDVAVTEIESESDAATASIAKNEDLLGCGISLTAALCAALAIIYIKKLANQVHCALQPMYYMLGMSVFCPIWSLIDPVTKAADLTLYGWELYLAVFGLACVAFA